MRPHARRSSFHTHLPQPVSQVYIGHVRTDNYFRSPEGVPHALHPQRIRQSWELSSLAARFAPALNALQSQTRESATPSSASAASPATSCPAPLAHHQLAITGLVSGHRDKADRIAAQYGVPSNSIYNYENFDEIVRNPNVDAVYVALPNSMHAEYTIRAAQARQACALRKTHVPSTLPKPRTMIAACKAANVKLMIAYRCHYEPTNLKAIR